MLFSGFYSERQCASCGHKVARTTPTSLIFFLMLAAGGTGVVVPGLARLYGPKWWYFAPVGGAELILVVVTLGGLDWIRDRILGSMETCPLCSGTMKPTISGMYDFGCLPTLLEVVLLVIFVALHIAIILWLRSASGAGG